MVERYCKDAGIHIETLSGGGRQRIISKARRELTYRLTQELGLSYAEIARLLGVSASAVAKIMIRRKEHKSL